MPKQVYKSRKKPKIVYPNPEGRDTPRPDIPTITQGEARRLANEATDRQAKIVKKSKELDKETEELLDEIEEILEENATEFVKAYVQKGGE